MERRRPGFAFQLFVMQVAVITAVAIAFTALAVRAQAMQVREDNEETIRNLAVATAALPAVIDGLQSPHPTDTIQPLIAFLREASDVDYITVVGMDGVRVAHTNPALIGSPVSSDHAPIRAGEEFVGVEVGPSGRTFRVKVPVWDDGTVVGTVSLGIEESRLSSDVLERALQLVAVAALAVTLGSALSWMLTRFLRRRLYGVDPEQIRTLLHTRDAVLRGIGDGLVMVDGDGRVVLVNEAARTLLGADAEQELEGRPAAEVLPAELTPMLQGIATSHSRDLTLGSRRLAVTAWQAHLEGRRIGASLLLQDRTDLLEALDELTAQRSRLTRMRRRTHEFDNRMHVIGGLLALGRHEEATMLLASDPTEALDTHSAPGTYSASGTYSALDPGADAGLGPGAGASSEDSLDAIRDPALAALLHSLQREARRRGVRLRLAEDSDVAEPESYDGVLTTIVGNLVTNALETAATQVRVYLGTDPDGLACRVEDDGPGVDPALGERIFDEGVSTKAAPGAERGIGLHLVRTLVTSRGGSVEVDTSDLGGAAFEVWLPAE